MGGDKGEGEQIFCHPHLSSPIKGEELHSNPVASYRNYQVKRIIVNLLNIRNSR
jgi:hypothetical protein